MNSLIKFEIQNLKIDTIIGIHNREKEFKQEVILDLEIYFDIKNAIVSDDIKDVVDYYQLSQDLINFVSNSKFELVESLSYRILEKISLDKRIKKAILSITKPKALEDFGAIVKITNEYNS